MPLQPIPPARFYAQTRPAAADSASSQQATSNDVNQSQRPPDTPFSRKFSAYNPFTSNHITRDHRMNTLGQEMEGKFVGPLPPKLFIEKYLPIVEDVLFRMPDWKTHRASFAAVPEKNGEVAMYEPMMKALETFCRNDFELVDTHDHVDSVNTSTDSPPIKPDISQYIKKTREALGSAKGETVITDVSIMEQHMEFKFALSDDPFKDKDAQFEHATGSSRDTRGQITTYAVAQLAYAFRTHLFSVVIIRNLARLILWDRSGAVVTKAFDYTTRPYLAEYFWRFTHSSAAARGWDQTVTEPDVTDAAVVVRARQALLLDETKKILKFAVYQDPPFTGATRGFMEDKDENSVRKKNPDPDVAYYYGSKPSFRGARSLAGRATRVYPVYDPQTDKVVSLKDAWRVDQPDVDREGDVYRSLHNAQVSHIPTCLRSGDVLPGEIYHETRTCKLREFKKNLKRHHHYRLVMEEVGRDLASFKSLHEVVVAMRDAIEGHSDAFLKANILHRDISVGNILITNDDRGLLIDWDLSKNVPNLTGARQPDRSGTWQFISAALLSASPTPPHTLADDLESFLWVLTWIVYRFAKHRLSEEAMTQRMQYIFDSHLQMDSGHVVGGDGKKNRALPTMGSEVSLRGDLPGLNKKGGMYRLLLDLADTFHVRYEEPPDEAAKKEYQETLDDVETLKISPDSRAYRQMVGGTAVYRYKTRLAHLGSSAWVLQQFDDAAKDQDSRWFVDGDERVEHKLKFPYPKAITERKRKNNDDDGAVPRQRQKYNTRSHDDEDADAEGEYRDVDEGWGEEVDLEDSEEDYM